MKKIKLIAAFICLTLFLLPFLWLKPGELELGGDSDRLYLLNPGNYLKATSLYSIAPEGTGKLAQNQNLIPFLLFLKLLYSVFHSPYLLMSLLNSIKLAGAFLFMYLIVLEILKNHAGKNYSFHIYIAGILAGLYYAFAPSVGENMHAALLTHNQVFLNPMIFYLMLRFLETHKNTYLWFILLTTLIFSPNFSLRAPPPLFSFYPLSFLFLALYITMILKKSLPWKKLFIGLVLFLGIHAFHLIPVFADIFDPGSNFNIRAFGTDANRNAGLDYFNGVYGLGKVSLKLFYSYATKEVLWTTIAPPLIIILGFVLQRRKQKDLLLVAVFFLITLFLITANITYLGVQFYRTLFYIPGFSMFRVFYGQWQWVYTFFYSLLFGFSLYIVLLRLKPRYVAIGPLFLAGIFTYNSWSFISGDVLRTMYWGSNNMTNIIKMNPHYEESLDFLSSLPDDGKVFNLPFTDYSYQVVPGANNGAYLGSSPVSYLGGKKAYSGYTTIDPFSDIFLKLAKEKNYEAIKKLFGLLNVRYIYYIADPKAFQENFPAFPYSLFLNSIPDSRSLDDFVRNIVDEKIFGRGDYFVYRVDKTNYLPHAYIPISLIAYEDKGDWYGKNSAFFVNSKESDARIGYVTKDTCFKLFSASKCEDGKTIFSENIPKLTYTRINPTKYKIEVSGASASFVLVLSDQFHKDWKLYISNNRAEVLPVRESYFDGSVNESKHENIFINTRTFETLYMNSITEDQHFMTNGYANAWYIKPVDAFGKDHYEVIIEMVGQRVFYYGLGISIISLGIFCVYGLTLLRR